MLDTIFATKMGMTQAWSTDGKRLPITRCNVGSNYVLGKTDDTLEIGYGDKKLKNTPKPLRERISKSGFSFGVTQLKGVRLVANEESEIPKVGTTITVDQVLEEGDIVQVQGVSKGRGFAGAMKRHGFHGGPKTHGQSDRSRAVGSIGSGTTPGRVWKGKRMPGHYGVETKTVIGLVVVKIDKETSEVWLNGPVPGFNTSVVKITKMGRKNEALKLAQSYEPEKTENEEQGTKN